MRFVSQTTYRGAILEFQPPIQVPEGVEQTIGNIAAYGALGPEANAGIVAALGGNFQRSFDEMAGDVVLHGIQGAIAQGGHNVRIKQS